MTTGALVFMLASWACVLSLLGWSFWRILRARNTTRPVANGDGMPPAGERGDALA